MELRQPANLVATRAKAYWAVQYGIFGVVLLVVAVVLSLTGVLTGAGEILAYAAIAVIVIVGVGIIPIWRFRVHRWEVTPTAVYTQTGWLTQERRIAPISRVQTVDTERGPIAQLFRLSTVSVTTASAKGHLTIEALDQQVADQIVRDLTATTAASSGDAT